MSEGLDQGNISPTEEPTESKEEVKKDFQGLIGSTKIFLSELLDIRTNTDVDATKEAIIADIPFKGHTAWILICSIFIASIGLNANSTAVVIGAMLISPLMGPILGMGMSLAINDIDTLRRSLKNLAVMVVLSVLTAFLFYWIFPLKTESSELLARTKPDIRDVLVAFFGGLALVIARAKKGTIASVIFGVAIATALMPPLCTVGYGLAIGNWDFVWGASLLFGINTIFIGLATFLVLKLLRFPMVRYANSKRRRLIARLVSLTALAVMVPAGWIFWGVYEEFVFDRYANEFIKDNVIPYKFTKDGRFLKDLTELKYSRDSTSTIELIFIGNEGVPDGVVATWTSNMKAYKDLNDVQLQIIHGSQNTEANQLKYVDELYQSQKNELFGKDEKIKLLESELNKIKRSNAKEIPFEAVSKEAKANYENLIELEYDNALITDFRKTDTLTIFQAKWDKNTKRNQIADDSKKLHNWLKIRLKDSTVQLKELPQN